MKAIGHEALYTVPSRQGTPLNLEVAEFALEWFEVLFEFPNSTAHQNGQEPKTRPDVF